MMNKSLLSTLGETRPVLIAGATASGKSALALEIAAQLGGVIVNADALQVYAGWRILTARPTAAEESRAPHALYGHVPNPESYSVGDWLRDIGPVLSGDKRPIIVGGTGLYFRALTEGLADIPPTPASIRAQSAELLAQGGLHTYAARPRCRYARTYRCAQPDAGCAGLGGFAVNRAVYSQLAGQDPAAFAAPKGLSRVTSHKPGRLAQ
jgi:tRNA A37 N6-isopentenylltransferase MiaA